MDIEQLLERIAIALEQKNQPQSTGLIHISRMIWLYVGREESESSSCWYTRVDGENIPQSANGLAGTIDSIECKETEYKGKISQKLQIIMQCADTRYCVQSGLDTMFSRGVMLSLLDVDPIDLLKPLTIAVRPSKEDEKIVFGSVKTDSWQRNEWDKETSCETLFLRLSKKFLEAKSSLSAKIDKKLTTDG